MCLHKCKALKILIVNDEPDDVRQDKVTSIISLQWTVSPKKDLPDTRSPTLQHICHIRAYIHIFSYTHLFITETHTLRVSANHILTKTTFFDYDEQWSASHIYIIRIIYYIYIYVNVTWVDLYAISCRASACIYSNGFCVTGCPHGANPMADANMLPYMLYIYILLLCIGHVWESALYDMIKMMLKKFPNKISIRGKFNGNDIFYL